MHSLRMGSYSQNRVQQLLLGKCLQTAEYDRLFFLSGLDYPLWNKNRFQQYFAENASREYVCGWNVTKGGDKRQNFRIEYYHPLRDIPMRQNNLLRKIIIKCAFCLAKAIGLRKPLQVRQKDGKLWDVYYGGSWMSMTSAYAKFVYETMESNRLLNKYFKTAFAPDELFIPTIVFNSSFAKNAIPVKVLDFQKLSPLHYLNYTDRIWSYDETDFDTIIASGKPFARKLVSGKSERLIELIEQSKT